MTVLHCELLAYQEDPGDYTIYVFKNLDYTGVLDRYIMCTKCPNWNSSPIEIGQRGYLKYKEIIAGKDSWYDSTSNDFIPYKYDGIQFFEFVKDKPKEDECIMV